MTDGHKDFTGGYAAWFEAVRRKVRLDQKLSERKAAPIRGKRNTKPLTEHCEPDRIKPTKERLAHAGENVSRLVNNDSNTVRVDDADMLDKLAGKLEKAQIDAGKKLYNHFFLAGISQERARTLIMERVDCEGSGGGDTESRMHHRQEFNAAIKVLPHGVSAVVLAVVIESRSLEQAGGFTKYRGRQQKITAAMTALQVGLDLLAEHFNLIPRRRSRYAFHNEGYDVEVREDLWEQATSND